LKKVSFNTAQKIFKLMINGKISREKADEWASSMLREEEEGSLVYSPAEDEEKIWDGIMYLCGVDLQVAPGEYLHTLEDIRETFIERFEGGESGSNSGGQDPHL